MKKIFAVLLSLTFLFSMAGCSNEENEGRVSLPSESASENDTESTQGLETESKNHQEGTSTVSETTVITLTSGDTVITAELMDSETTRAFLETLPRTLTMNRYDDREYYGRIESITEDGEAIADFENGDVTYYPAGPSFAVFFDGEERSDQSGLIRMGKITSDLTAFNFLGDSAEITIEIAE